MTTSLGLPSTASIAARVSPGRTAPRNAPPESAPTASTIASSESVAGSADANTTSRLRSAHRPNTRLLSPVALPSPSTLRTSE